MNIIKHRKIYFAISGILFVASLLALLVWGLRLGIDFTGGSLLEAELSQNVNILEIKEKLIGLDVGDVSAQPVGEKGAILRMKDINEETHQKILTALDGAQEKRFESIGPVVGEELKRRAIYAVSLTLLMIVVYIAWAFRKVSRPVPSWQYGLATLIALFHDVFLPAGIFALLGHYKGAEIGLLFITAILTVLGFSVHDTIVVFDRIRENLRRGMGNSFEQTVDLSVNQTLTRSINTSLTVLLTLLAVYFLGGETIKYFVLTLIIGIVFGTYSSIFIASPLLVFFNKLKKRR
jgi:preprotein translocase subunit SecF